MSEARVEVLTFEGCPHAGPALALVVRVVAAAGIDATIQRVDIPDPEAANEQRFLGSPSIRVNGHDIEPGADQRSDYALSCRLYRTTNGMKGEPDETWLREALRRNA